MKKILYFIIGFFSYRDADLLPQIRAFALCLCFFNAISYIIDIVFDFGLSGLIGVYEFQTLDIIFMFLTFALSPISLYISYMRKEYWGIVATIPAFLNWPLTFFNPDGILALILFVALPIFSFAYVEIKREAQLNTVLIALCCTYLPDFGFQETIVLIIQVLFFVFLWSYLIIFLSKVIKENRNFFYHFGKRKFCSLAMKAFILWIPFGIIIIIGFLPSHWLDEAALKLDKAFVEYGTHMSGNLVFDEVECKWWDIACVVNPVRMAKDQFNSLATENNFPEKTKNGTLLLSAIFRNILEISSVLTYFFMIFLAFRSFSYVFARISISTEHNLPATLKKQDSVEVKGNVGQPAPEYVIHSIEREKFYVKRKYEPSGRPPKFSLPQGFSCIIARIFSKSYVMNEIQMQKGTGHVRFTSTGGSNFIEWNLKNNEEIIFHFGNFVAMSESVRLSTVFSFSLTGMIFGRFFYTRAKGPGKIIFQTHGKAISYGNASQAESLPIQRIIAWQRNARFDVLSELRPIDIFLSGIHFKLSSNHTVIIDVDEQNTPDSGLMKFVKQALLPI